MFCYQCEQTSKGNGCEKKGVCGKDAQVAALQDLLIFAVKVISQYANKARQSGVKDREVDIFVVEALFSTMTNVSFDPARFESLLRRAASIKTKAKNLLDFN